jgi:hypothetical protein
MAQDEMYRWVLVTEGREVVGHLAAMPQYYRINGQRIVAHTPADYRVLPRYGFHAVLLMRKFFRSVQNCVACDVEPAVIGVQARMGAEVAGKLYYAAKVLDVSKLSLLPSSIPTAVPRFLNRGLRAVDRVLTSGFEDNMKARVLEGFDRSFDRLFEKIAAIVPCVAEKDSAFLRWRYGPSSPQSQVTILGVRGEDGLLGYAVLWVSVEVDRNGYILDLTTLPGRRDVARALLREAVRHFRQVEGVPLIKYLFLGSSTSPQAEDLWRLGFFFREEGRYMMQIKFADAGLHRTASDTAHWSYNIGDGEPSFWV